jgi:6-phosphofructokinase
LESLNTHFKNFKSPKHGQKFAVLLLGNAAPGGNNIIDGLLRFQNKRRGTILVGYVNGVDGVLND